MKISYLLPFPELNGGNKVIFQHAQLLVEGGHEVTVLGEGPWPRWARIERWIDLTREAPALPPQDLTIATFWTTLERADQLALGPLAHFCQGYEGALPHNARDLPRIEAAYARPVPTLVVSPHLAPMLAERFGRESRAVPPPLDPLFHPAPRQQPDRAPWIAVPGIFESEVKDVPTALLAIRLLREAGIPCRVLRFSTFPLSDAERALLPPDRYLHAVEPRELADALRQCDLLMLPSREAEGFGLPLLEAMASGVPAVASRIPSAEIIGNGAARLVDAQDAAAFARACRELLDDPPSWRGQRERGLVRARDYDAAAVAPLLEEAVEWAAERAAHPANGPARRPYRVRADADQPRPEERRVDLNANPAELRPQYQGASPFPHIAIDGLFADELLEEVLAAFPRPDDIPWKKFESATEKKLGWVHTAPLRPAMREFLWQMSSPPVLQFLEALTGIEGLIPDPYFGGAGPHQILPGGFLKVHADFNWHPLLKLDRRLNLLVYLNKDWREEYGGHLELWDREMKAAERCILPVFNRTVVFSTTDFSYHGHPRPLACPDGMTRKSVSFYYYTNGRPDEERSAPHDTLFRKTHEGDW